VFVASLIYGLAHIASGSVTLMAVAFVCGLAWGLLRVATRSLWAPILTHVLWDLVIVFVWPLA
jgi:membrane protease YdiL (CAAX protease family)